MYNEERKERVIGGRWRGRGGIRECVTFEKKWQVGVKYIFYILYMKDV